MEISMQQPFRDFVFFSFSSVHIEMIENDYAL